MMHGLTRRRALMIAAGTAPAMALGSALTAFDARAAALLVHDDTLPAAARFALRAQALGTPSQAIMGERVRFIRELLKRRPMSVFGVTRHADSLLFADIAREMGYVERASIQHRVKREAVARCSRKLSMLSDAAGPCWPEAFAELAVGTTDANLAPIASAAKDAAFSWILEPRT